MNYSILPEFQQYLLSRGLVPENQVPFHAVWVSKFLGYANRYDEIDHDLKIQTFLQYLNSGNNTEDWQVRQAEEALRLYFGHFLAEVNNNSPSGLSNMELPVMVKQMREVMKVKHYSYRTEQTYIEWVKRFYSYVRDIKKKNLGISGLESEDVRDFISYLATRKRVSSSTQNQAFNALLFLFRHVLSKNLEKINSYSCNEKNERCSSNFQYNDQFWFTSLNNQKNKKNYTGPSCPFFMVVIVLLS